jgi:hypothetical protein
VEHVYHSTLTGGIIVIRAWGCRWSSSNGGGACLPSTHTLKSSDQKFTEEAGLIDVGIREYHALGDLFIPLKEVHSINPQDIRVSVLIHQSVRVGDRSTAMRHDKSIVLEKSEDVLVSIQEPRLSTLSYLNIE